MDPAEYTSHLYKAQTERAERNGALLNIIRYAGTALDALDCAKQPERIVRERLESILRMAREASEFTVES